MTRKARRAPAHTPVTIGDRQLAERLVSEHETREAARMAEAHRRAELVGKTPHLAAARRLAREVAVAELSDSTAPAIMAADLHTVLLDASRQDLTDRGLRMAAAHAYKVWTDDPEGALALGEVVQFQTHYKREHPKSRVAAVIDDGLAKVGFNTLPLRRLAAVAAEITRDVAKGADAQEAYEFACHRHALEGRAPVQVRARALVRKLVEAQFEADPAGTDGPGPSPSPMSPPGEAEEAAVPMDVAPDDDGNADDTATLDSPITGEPLIIELESEDEAIAEEQDGIEVGNHDVDVSADEMGRLEHMGQLSDFGPDEPAEPDAEPAGGDAAMIVMDDPTDPNGGQLEVSVRPVADSAPAPDAEPEPAAPSVGGGGDGFSLQSGGDDDAEHPEWGDEHPKWAVWAYAQGKRGDAPLDTFSAPGMAAALRRLASYGVHGDVRSTAAALGNECMVVLDDDRGEYLHVTRVAAPEASQGMPCPEVSGQPDDAVDVPEDGAAALRATATQVEAQLLAGETVKVAGWSLRINEDADIELRKGTGHARTAGLAHLDDMIANFLAQAYPPQAKRHASAAQHATQQDLRHVVTAAFALKCAGCGSTNTYLMPDEAADLGCGCGYTTTAAAAAERWAAADLTTGHFVVTDVPGANNREQRINARRMLAAVQRIAPDARGTLRTDGKLQIEIGPERKTYDRIAAVLRDKYGVEAGPKDKRAQLDDAPIEPMPDADPGLGGPDDLGAPADPMGAPPSMGPDMGAADPMGMSGLGGGLAPDEADAMKAALTHFRNQGLGPGSGYDKLLSQYKDLFERHGDETDQARHAVEAEAMRLTAEVWMKPAVLDADAEGAMGPDMPFGSAPGAGAGGLGDMGAPPMPANDEPGLGMDEAAGVDDDPMALVARRKQAVPTPGKINPQQPDAVKGADLPGKDSESDDAMPSPGSIGARPGPAVKVQKGLGKDSDTKDPGNFGARKPKVQHPATDQAGVSLCDTDLGRDSDTAQDGMSRMFDSVSNKAKDSYRSK